MQEHQITMEENIWEQVTEFDTDEFVIIDHTNLSETSIFPPDNHQDLPLTTPEAEENSSDDIQEVPRRGDDQRWREWFKMTNSGIIRVAYKVRFYAGCLAKLWPVAAAAGLLVVMVFYRKVNPWRRRRIGPEYNKDHWMLLSREKDQVRLILAIEMK